MFHLLLGIIYLAFISLGLPDSLLGSAWPVMYREFSVPVSYAGVISMIISAGTIFSSLQSDRLTRRFGTGRVTAASVCMTAVSLLGFSTSGSYLELCLWAVPYGLGAGSVDASLNNYVARRSLPGTIYYGGCAGRRPWMEYGIPLYCRAPVCSYCCSCSQSSPVEKEADVRRESCLFVHRDRQQAPVHWRDCQAPRCKRDSGGLFLLQRSGADGGTLGWQLSGVMQGNFGRGGGRFCQPVFPWNYGGKGDQRLSDYEAGGYPDDTPWRSCNFSGNFLPFPALWEQSRVSRPDSHRTGMRSHLSVYHSFYAGAFRSRQIPGSHRRADGLRLCGKPQHAASVRRDCQPCKRGFISRFPDCHPGTDGCSA